MASTATPTPPPYSLMPRPPAPWIDIQTGQPTPFFYRFIVYLFQSLGSGQSGTNLALLVEQVDLITNETAALQAALNALNDYVLTTPDPDMSPLESAIRDLAAFVLTSRNLSSTVSALQGRVNYLEALFLTQRVA